MPAHKKHPEKFTLRYIGFSDWVEDTAASFAKKHPQAAKKLGGNLWVVVELAILPDLLKVDWKRDSFCEILRSSMDASIEAMKFSKSVFKRQFLGSKRGRAELFLRSSDYTKFQAEMVKFNGRFPTNAETVSDSGNPLLDGLKEKDFQNARDRLATIIRRKRKQFVSPKN